MLRTIIAVCCALLLAACSERPEQVEKKLDVYLQEDLKFMVAETFRASHDREALLDSPYYKIRDLRFFDREHSKMYSAYAEVDFYIYRNIKMFETRKYRYDAEYLQWDRYLKTLRFGTDSK
jgi:hypothetical protein